MEVTAASILAKETILEVEHIYEITGLAEGESGIWEALFHIYI